MTSRVLLAVSALLTGLLLSCDGVKSSGPVPDWVNNPKSDTQFFYAVGYYEGTETLEKSKTAAFGNALGVVAAYIIQETSVQKVFDTSAVLSKNDDIRTSYQEQIKTQSQGRIAGLEAIEYYWKEKNDGGLLVREVYVLTKILRSDIEKERKRILDDLKRKLELVDKNIRDAERFVSGGQIVEAIRSYITAAISSTKVEDRSDEFIIYINQATTLIGNLMMEAAKDNPRSADIKNGTNFSFYLYYSGASGKIPVKGAKVNFTLRNNNGQYTKSGVTTDDGKVECRVDSLKEVRFDTQIHAKIFLDFGDIATLTGDYKKYEANLSDMANKVFASLEFKTAAAENRNIPTMVVAVVNADSGLKQMQVMASKVKEMLVSKGFKVVSYDGSVTLEAVNDADKNALSTLNAKGIKQIAFVLVESLPEPEFREKFNRYIATYSVSFRLIDTATGEDLAALSKKLMIDSSDKSGNIGGFVAKAADEIKAKLP